MRVHVDEAGNDCLAREVLNPLGRSDIAISNACDAATLHQDVSALDHTPLIESHDPATGQRDHSRSERSGQCKIDDDRVGPSARDVVSEITRSTAQLERAGSAPARKDPARSADLLHRYPPHRFVDSHRLSRCARLRKRSQIDVVALVEGHPVTTWRNDNLIRVGQDHMHAAVAPILSNRHQRRRIGAAQPELWIIYSIVRSVSGPDELSAGRKRWPGNAAHKQCLSSIGRNAHDVVPRIVRHCAVVGTGSRAAHSQQLTAVRTPRWMHVLRVLTSQLQGTSARYGDLPQMARAGLIHAGKDKRATVRCPGGSVLERLERVRSQATCTPARQIHHPDPPDGLEREPSAVRRGGVPAHEADLERTIIDAEGRVRLFRDHAMNTGREWDGFHVTRLHVQAAQFPTLRENDRAAVAGPIITGEHAECIRLLGHVPFDGIHEDAFGT